MNPSRENALCDVWPIRTFSAEETLAEHFDTDFDDLDWKPRFIVAPTQVVPVIRRVDAHSPPGNHDPLGPGAFLGCRREDRRSEHQNINARSETAASKPSFRDSLRRQRCLIPADGFYDWRRTGKQKQPLCFEVENGSVFAFAGLWDHWRAPDGTTRLASSWR